MLRTYQGDLRCARGKSAPARNLQKTPETVQTLIPASAQGPCRFRDATHHERSSAHDEPGFDDRRGHPANQAFLDSGQGRPRTGAGRARGLAVLWRADWAVALTLCDRNRRGVGAVQSRHTGPASRFDRRSRSRRRPRAGRRGAQPAVVPDPCRRAAHGPAARDQSGDDRARRARPRAAQLRPAWPVQVLPRCPPDLQHVGVHPRHRTLAAAGGARHRLRRPVRCGQSGDRAVGVPAQSKNHPRLCQRPARAVLDHDAGAGLAVHPCALAAQEGRHHDRCRRPGAAAASAPRPGRIPGPVDDSAFADPVQFAVCGAIHSRRPLSLGPCGVAGQHDLCRLRPSRRLSADRDRAARRRFRAGRNASGRAG